MYSFIFFVILSIYKPADAIRKTSIDGQFSVIRSVNSTGAQCVSGSRRVAVHLLTVFQCSELKSRFAYQVSFPGNTVFESEQNGTVGSGYWSAFEIEVQPSCRVSSHHAECPAIMQSDPHFSRSGLQSHHYTFVVALPICCPRWRSYVVGRLGKYRRWSHS